MRLRRKDYRFGSKLRTKRFGYMKNNCYINNMKISIWVHKRDIENGKITNFHNICPQGSDWPNWYQVEIDQDTFVQLSDNKTETWNGPKPDLDQEDFDNQPFAD